MPGLLLLLDPHSRCRPPARLLAFSCRSGSIFNWRQIVGFPDRLPYGHLYNPPPPYRIERPKVTSQDACCKTAAAKATSCTHVTALASLPQILYHPTDKRFILYFHLDTPGFEVPAVGIAVSSKITGEARTAGRRL